MKLTGYEDLRVQKTVRAIYDAFESLILEKPYEKITVKELSDRAQINKKTFYRYYPTLDDLLAEMQAQYSREYLKVAGKFEYPRDIDKSVRSFFEFSAKQGDAYDRITTSRTYSTIRQQMIDSVMSQTWDKSSEFQKLTDWQRRLLLEFVQETGLIAYRQWIESGREADLNDVIEATSDLMRGGICKLLEASR